MTVSGQQRGLALGLFVGGALVLGTGCASREKMQAPWWLPHARMETLHETPDEHSYNAFRVLELDSRALAEDIDLLFQTDRPSRLTRWHDR